VLSSPDFVSGFRGLAGTGKTTTLRELRRAIEQAGLAAVFCAPTAAATDVLRKDGFSDASTLAKLLHSGTLPRRAVVVLDEAGFVGTGDMAGLFKLAHKHDSRVVLVGDTGQHAAITTPVVQPISRFQEPSDTLQKPRFPATGTTSPATRTTSTRTPPTMRTPPGFPVRLCGFNFRTQSRSF